VGNGDQGTSAEEMSIDAHLQSTIVQAVEARRGDLIELVQELVQVPSLTGDEGPVQAVVAERMRAMGLDVEVWEPDVAELAPYAEYVGEFDTLQGRPNVVGRWSGVGGGRSLILNAHIDVVDAGDPSRWTYPPFAATVVDGKIVGRGACDMKAGLATHLMAVSVLAELGLKPRGDLIVESVISEEDGGAGTLAAILHGYRADAAIITEPTDLAVVPAQGGSLVFRLHVTGRSAHGAARDEGVSAIEKFALLHRALLDFEAERNANIKHPLYTKIANKIPISIGVIHGGTWPSSVPESLFAEGRAGLVPGEDLTTFKREFIAAVDRAADGDEWLREVRPRVEWFSGQFAPAEISVDSPLVTTLMSAHEEVTGTRPAVNAATFGADLRHFVIPGGIPCVMYGAGDVRQAHYTDESITIDDILTATKTITTMIVRWCGIERC
jgi:acetylornithine deacetylase